MKFIPNGASLALGRAALKTRKHSPVIMFSVGIAGSVASTVLACRATLKLEEVLQQSELKKDQIAYAEEHKPEEVYSKKDAENDRRILRVQTVANVAKLYAPAICVGVASIGLLTGSHVVLTKRNTALLAAYGVLERGFNEYRARVRDELGEAKDLEYRYGAVEKEIVEEGEHGHEVKTIRRIDPNADLVSTLASSRRTTRTGSRSLGVQPVLHPLPAGLGERPAAVPRARVPERGVRRTRLRAHQGSTVSAGSSAVTATVTSTSV
jgi:hypothetical protein